MAEVLAYDVDVVALGIERCDVPLGALLAVVPVVVVGADVGDLVLAEDPDEAAGEGRLARRRVADDAEYGGPGQRSRSFSRPCGRRRCSSAGPPPRSSSARRARAPSRTRTAGSPGAGAPGRWRCGCCGRARSAASAAGARCTRETPPVRPGRSDTRAARASGRRSGA